MTNFPETPTLTDPPEEHVTGGVTWIYDGEKWVKKSSTIRTDNVELYDPTNPAAVVHGSYGYARKVPDVPADVATQFDVNQWFVSALQALDSSFDNGSGGLVAGIHVNENEPADKENGTLWFDNSEDSLTLLLYYDPDGDPNTAAWIPAAPPVSVIEEINGLLQGLGDDLDLLEARVLDLNTHGTEAPNPVQDGYIWKNTVEGEERSYIYCQGRQDGTSGWELLSPNSRISDIAPENPEKGDLWFEPTTTKTLSVYDSTQWVQLTVGADGVEKIETIEEDQGLQDERLDQLELKVGQLESGGGGTPIEGGATVDYVDAQDALRVNKSGDTITGLLNISSEGEANNDGVRVYVKDTDGNTNLTVFPTGVVTSKNVIRVNRDSGDCFQVKDAAGNSVKYKVDALGRIESPRLKLTGGNDAAVGERVIDVKQGHAGRLTYNEQSKLSWGYSYVGIGPVDAVGDPAIDNFQLILYGHAIEQVGSFQLVHEGTSEKKFSIKGELADGTTDSADFFYSYRNPDGTADAMNYNGKIDNNANLVNKKYVDDQVAGVSTDNFVAKSGDTMTGKLVLNNSANPQINFNKGGNCDIEYKGSWIVSFQGNDTPLVKLNSSVDMNNKAITNVADATGDKHAMNRRSVVGAKVVAQGGSSNAQSGGFYFSDGRLFYKM